MNHWFGARLGALVIPFALVVAACDSGRSDWLPRYQCHVVDGTCDAGLAAALGGVLTRDGHCLYATESDGRRWLLIFPPTASWNDGENAAVVHGRAYVVGGSLAGLGGGEGKAPEVLRLTSPTPDRSCDTSLYWLVADAPPA
jgi:hypothetical protein